MTVPSWAPLNSQAPGTGCTEGALADRVHLPAPEGQDGADVGSSLAWTGTRPVLHLECPAGASELVGPEVSKPRARTAQPDC